MHFLSVYLRLHKRNWSLLPPDSPTLLSISPHRTAYPFRIESRLVIRSRNVTPALSVQLGIRVKCHGPPHLPALEDHPLIQHRANQEMRTETSRGSHTAQIWEPASRLVGRFEGREPCQRFLATGYTAAATLSNRRPAGYPTASKDIPRLYCETGLRRSRVSACFDRDP